MGVTGSLCSVSWGDSWGELDSCLPAPKTEPEVDLGWPPPLHHCAAKAISGYPAACISCPPPQLLQGDRKGRMEPNGLGREQGL